MTAVNSRIGVGIVGASARRGWASVAHIPALRADPDFTLAAVAASTAQRATEAAQRYDVPLAFGDYRELVSRPEVDVVVVSVKLPLHFEIVMAALDAGKHVYCEWPLGRTIAESVALAERASGTGLVNVIGLQARSSPAIRHLRHLAATDYLGTLQGISMVGHVPAFGAQTDAANAYINDRSSGASLLSISFAHSVDALCWAFGELHRMSARLAVRTPSVRVVDTGETIVRTSPDQVAVSGTLAGGAPVSIHFQGGRSAFGNFHWIVSGSERQLSVVARDGNLQMSEIELLSAVTGSDEPVRLTPAPRYDVTPRLPEGPAYNLARVYRRLSAQLLDSDCDDEPLPDFAQALHRQQMIAKIQELAENASD